MYTCIWSIIEQILRTCSETCRPMCVCIYIYGSVFVCACMCVCAVCVRLYGAIEVLLTWFGLITLYTISFCTGVRLNLRYINCCLHYFDGIVLGVERLWTVSISVFIWWWCSLPVSSVFSRQPCSSISRCGWYEYCNISV